MVLPVRRQAWPSPFGKAPRDPISVPIVCVGGEEKDPPRLHLSICGAISSVWLPASILSGGMLGILPSVFLPLFSLPWCTCLRSGDSLVLSVDIMGKSLAAASAGFYHAADRLWSSMS